MDDAASVQVPAAHVKRAHASDAQQLLQSPQATQHLDQNVLRRSKDVRECALKLRRRQRAGAPEYARSSALAGWSG